MSGDQLFLKSYFPCLCILDIFNPNGTLMFQFLNLMRLKKKKTVGTQFTYLKFLIHVSKQTFLFPGCQTS